MSQNLFADLDMPNPEERLLKAKLVLALRELVNASNLTQAQVAERAGLTQPAVSRMLKGMTKEISVEKLLNTMVALGQHVHIIIGGDEPITAGTSVELKSISKTAGAAA